MGVLPQNARGRDRRAVFAKPAQTPSRPGLLLKRGRYVSERLVEMERQRFRLVNVNNRTVASGALLGVQENFRVRRGDA